jgi:TfoX/Sxy family transcriptional regulator of competence genes
VRANDRLEPLLNRMPRLREQARSLYYTLNERAFDDAWRLEPEVEQALAERLETEVAAVRRLIADDQLRPLHGERPAWL